MKTIHNSLALFIIFLFVSPCVHAQSYWGLTARGGTKDFGTIFSTNSAGTGHQVRFSFPESTGDQPFGDLMEASNGLMYGVASSGGSSNNGILFEFNPENGTFIVRASFTGVANGREPRGSLVEGPNGKLYGTTMLGGANNEGVLFEYDTATHILTKKLDFSSATTGRDSDEGLLLATNGKIYGVNPQGGANGAGTLYEYDIALNTLTVKVDFLAASSGSVPVGSLIQSPSGLLYGCTLYGGTYGYGVLYSYNISTNTCTIQCSFNGTGTGRNPSGTPCLASNGTFYGTTAIGGANNQGTIWGWNPSGTLTNLLSFSSTTGGFSRSAMTEAPNGILFGFTALNQGTIFSYNPSTSQFTNIGPMSNQEVGTNPFSSWLVCSNGRLYSQSRDGGAGGFGAIFSMDPATQQCKLEWSFVEAFRGREPRMGLVGTGSGKLIGVCMVGGLYGYGTLFEFDSITNIVRVIQHFDGANMGQNPEAPPTQGTDGLFYGVTTEGGANFNGVIYAYDPILDTIFKKADIPPYGSSFGTPTLALTQAINGKFYGLATGGGAYSDGMLYEYDITSNSLSNKFDFTGVFGANPHSAMINGTDGKLYGTTGLGGLNDDGVLFSYDVNADTLIVLADFNQTTTGRYPMFNHLVEWSPGIFYGTCTQGGNGNTGTIFRYNAMLDTLVRVYSFPTSTTNDGWYPHGAMVPTPNGAMLGMNWTGGTGTKGTIYKYVVAGGCSTTVPFNTANGAYPYNELYYSSAVPFILTCSNDTSICENSDFTAFVSAFGGNLNYQWLYNGTPISGATGSYLIVNNVNAASAGDYTCIVSTASGSDTTGIIQLQVLPAPNIVASATDTAICPGDSVMLSMSGGVTYSWSPAVLPNVYFVPAATVTYTLTGTGANGCSGTDQITISVGCSGVPEQSPELYQASAYPNPFTNSFSLHTHAIETGSTALITDAAGKIVRSFIVTGETTLIDGSDLQQGLYFIVLNQSIVTSLIKLDEE